MNRWLLTLATATVRGWTWLYTRPLEGSVREARRAEIASDLWEYEHDGSGQGADGIRGTHVLIRAWLGVPDDLMWGCEQLQTHLFSARNLWRVIRFAIVGITASTLVVSAHAPVVNLTQVLRVNVESTGWLTVGNSQGDATLVPAVSFTLTNVADRPLGALQVNAVFYLSDDPTRTPGIAFLYAVGWRGLASRATSPSLMVRPHGQNQPAVAHLAAPEATVQPSALRQSSVRLFVKHEGNWTRLGDYPIQRQPFHP
jgi:hypothetical protein